MPSSSIPIHYFLTSPSHSAITTPHKLSAFDASAALRVLLSPAERAQPLRLYLAPGVAFALVLEALISPTLSLLRFFVFPRVPLGAALGAALPLLILTTALTTPLQVMVTRLTLQRLGGGPDDTAAAVPTYPEQVLTFRTDEAPYTGLLDCFRKTVEEEGWRVLYRAWWLAAVLLLFPIFTPMFSPPTF